MKKTVFSLIILILFLPSLVFAVPGFPTTPTVVNQQITKQTSYGFRISIPTGASMISLQSRQATDFTTVWAPADGSQTPDTTAYFTVKSGTVFKVQETAAQNTSIYLKSNTTTPQDIEVQFWN